MLIWIALILLIAGCLTIGVERLMARFRIHPERPEERAGGIRDVIQRLTTRSDRRR